MRLVGNLISSEGADHPLVLGRENNLVEADLKSDVN